MTATRIPGLTPGRIQAAEERRTELCCDISNAGTKRGSFVTSTGAAVTHRLSPSMFQSRPTILRRAAALLADSVPRATDRLVGYRRSAAPLVVAVALETGLPFALLESGDPARPQAIHRVGEVLANEQLLLLADVLNAGDSTAGAGHLLAALGGHCLGVLAAVDLREDAAGLGGPPLLGALCHGRELRW